MTRPAPRDRSALHYPVELVIASSVSEIPTGPAWAWAYQPKWDGWRVLARVRDGRVQLHTLAGKPLASQLRG
ncbi:hypothetical protein AB0J82_34705 [Asanoa sp. NPDC049518]|uniref:hypothetical protein n=1 Tax=unclassified Asanoa TaxID=2685164 RepID=UPI003420847B